MALIECKLGPTSQHVRGTTYSFDKDRFGRFVARVHHLEDIAIFKSVEHYQEVPEEPEKTKLGRTKAPGLIVPQTQEPQPAADGGDDGANDAAGGEGEGNDGEGSQAPEADRPPEKPKRGRTKA